MTKKLYSSDLPPEVTSPEVKAYLKAFFVDWLKWVDSGAPPPFTTPPHIQYSRKTGLCHALNDYSLSMRPEAGDIITQHRAYVLLHAMLKYQFRCDSYPFSEPEEYSRRAAEGTNYCLPERVEWARKMAEGI